ncbi:MAG: aminotransferase class V-fold PLP-dependent enzyme, partial [Bacteroidales bacterium]|nr:aminotransferase class V-fold PLP-dependent enzyme [Bacteroidales bacterium]
VQDLDCDFYCLSGHKIYGPMGIGVLYGKEKWLEQLPPYQGGGEMIKQVSIQKTTYADLPFKFEAGMPNVGDAMGLEAAIRFVSYMRLDSIEASECYLLEYATQKLLELGNVRIIGTAKNKASVLSFLLKDIHPYDTGVLLDKMGIAVRTGHHCAQPVMDKLGIPGTVRASFAVYNTTQEIDLMVEALKKITQMFS